MRMFIIPLLTFLLTLPQYAQDKAEIETLVQKYKSGKKLTEAQLKLIDDIVNPVGKTVYKNPPSPSKGALSESFETWPPSGWTIIQGPDSPTNDITQSNTYAHSGTYSARFSSYSSASGYDEYLITPQLNVTSGDQTFSFWYRKYDWGSEVFQVGWSSTGTDIADFTWGPAITDASTTWQQYTKTDVPVGTKYIAIHYYSDYQYYLYVDDVTGPELYTSSTQPGQPSNPSPTDGATNVAYVSGTLTWDFGANTDKYDLWLGPSGNMSKVVSDGTASGSGNYSYSNLNFGETYQWQVIAKNSTTGETTNGPVWSFTTALPEGLKQIGSGTNTDKHLPIEPFYKYTYSQTIYHASDFGSVGSNKRIAKIYYNYHKSSSNDHDADNWVIYMGTTSSSTISDWIPVSSLTKVFDGNTGFGNLSTGDGWLEITLETPFNYNPSNDGNLVVAVDENSEGWTSGSDDFYCDQNTSKANVSIYYYADGTNPDPNSPPSGTTSSYYPNIRFLFEDMPTEPVFYVSPTSVDFGTVYLTETSSYQTITVKNIGVDTLQISGVTITGTNASDFTLSDTNSYPVSLSSGQTTTVQVRFAPSDDSTRSATLRFTANAKTYHDVSLIGTGYDATVSSFPYNESFSSFSESTNATGFADNWRTSPSNTSSLFRWNPNKGNTTTSDTGPAVDHTSGSSEGMYLYTEASYGYQGDVAYLYPPPFNLDSLNNPAVSFYYHMYGENMGKLEFQVSTDGGSTWTTLATISGQHQISSNDIWEPFYTELSSYAHKTVKFRFKATRGNGYRGDMAIDDFYVGEKMAKKLDSVKVEQASTSNVILGTTNNEILKLIFHVSPGSGTLPLNSIAVTSGNDNDANIAENGVKLYRTSTPSFFTDSLFATGSFSSGKVTFGNLNYDLPSGRSYFWLTYDIKEAATLGDSMDAKILANDINVNGATYNSVDSDPPGKRAVCGLVVDSIKVEQASYGDIPAGSKDVPLLKIGFYVSESPTRGASSLQISSLKVGIVTQYSGNISKIKLYRTEGDTFSKDSLVSEEDFDEDAAWEEMLKNGTQEMTAGDLDAKYFIACDLNNHAADCDTLDAYVPANGVTINGQTYNSHIENPTGYRIIRNYYHGGNGTDYGGYYFANSTQNGGSNRPAYNWIDTLGMNRIGANDWTAGNADDGYKKVPLPFTFNYFGQNYDTLCIGTNGMIGFGSNFPYTTWGTSIPSTELPNNMIATAGMNLIPGSDGKIYYGTVGGNFVVTWFHYHYYAVPTEWITCQTIIKPNGNIKMQYNYSESRFGPGIMGDALIGIENSDGTVGHQYRNDGFGGPMVDSLGKAGSLAIEYSKNESATPVELSSFSAIPNDEGVVEIKWTTQTEINAAFFEIERTEITSDENTETEWQTIGSVQAAGNSNSPKEYSFRDELEHSGKYKYRLKMVDVDGSYKYGNEVEVTADIALKYELSQNYPNPFNPTTTIKFSIKKEGNVKLEVFNVLGQRVSVLLNKKMKAGKYKVKFDASNYASGVYFYRIKSGDFQAVRKMMLLK